jgi:hypothetical protein
MILRVGVLTGTDEKAAALVEYADRIVKPALKRLRSIMASVSEHYTSFGKNPG